MKTPHILSRLGGTVLICLMVWAVAGHSQAAEPRRVIPLDGTWQVAQGGMDAVPKQFAHQVPVPGLVDMAEPAFAEVGTEASKQYREAFWYRRTFRIQEEVTPLVRLRINKAKYGTRVFLNGQLVGDHLPCFTPVVFDVTDLVRGNGAENELVIRVGALRESVPRSIPDGWDFEKVRYIPGIYDSVSLILSGTPHVDRVQTVPQLASKSVRIVATLSSKSPGTTTTLRCQVREAASGRVAGSAESEPIAFSGRGDQQVELNVPISDCRLWWPEDPFLYEAEISTGSDSCRVRFGMRSFQFDPQSKLPLLNGQTYPLRGTNVCIYRFFEDPARSDLPWRKDWVRQLHRTFRQMHWNSIRYCIGFPPDFWYDIADEEGLLIQDEFPIWYLSRWPEQLTADELVREYTDWIHTRCNHPCVVIWDAQNETRTDETGKAIQAVRHLDLSGRPWDNGWAPPQSPDDVFEAHPYPFYSAKGSGKPTNFRLGDFASMPRKPGVEGGIRGGALLNTGDNPIIINEYGWLWLNRDGTPTTLSEANYAALLGPDATADQRRELYARYLAAMTEFWRSGRQVAGVLHFCGLGYSRAGGETSDHFLDLENLVLEPHFRHFVGDAFSSVGLAIDHWAEQATAGAPLEVPVVVLNDRAEPWAGDVQLAVVRDGQTLREHSQPCRVDPIGREVLRFRITLPEQPGKYDLVARLNPTADNQVRSYRQVTLLRPE